MNQFYRRKGVVFFDGIRGGVEIGQHLRIIQRDTELVGDPGFQVDAALAHINNGRPAPGLALKNGNIFRGQIAILSQVGDIYRGSLNTVFQGIGSNFNRTE